MSEFFAMGGHAVYVWGSYGLAAVILVGLLLASIHARRANEATLRALEAALVGPRRRRSRGGRAGDGGEALVLMPGGSGGKAVDKRADADAADGDGSDGGSGGDGDGGGGGE